MKKANFEFKMEESEGQVSRSKRGRPPTEDKKTRMLSLMSDSKELLETSKVSKGALGALSFSILEGLTLGGLEAEEVKRIKSLLKTHLENLSSEQCNHICQVMKSRLDLDRDVETGVWYP